jgi:hypothetical protein
MITSKPFYVLQYNDTFHKNVRGRFANVGNEVTLPVSNDPLNPRVSRFEHRKDALSFAGTLFHVRKVSATYTLGE